MALNAREALDGCSGVGGFNIVVGDVDIETLDMSVTIEGENLNYDEIVKAIENTGAVVHGLEQIAVGERLIEPVERAR